jgi:hypothetical protein
MRLGRPSSSAASSKPPPSRGEQRRAARPALLGAIGAWAALGCRDAAPPAPPPTENVAASPASAAASAPTLEELTLPDATRALWPGHQQVTYQPPTTAALAALLEVAQALWLGVDADEPRVVDLAARADDAGYRLRRWRVGGREAWVLQERPDHEHGQGTYLFRVGAAGTSAGAVLQAPHAYFDKQSGDIAAAIYFAADAPPTLRALTTNSVHRYQVRPGVRKKARNSPTDVCHNPEHVFSHVTDALLGQGARGIFQVHGFADRPSDDDDDRDDAARPGAAADTAPAPAMLAVVSAGGKQRPTGAARALAAALVQAFGPGVLTYPEQTKELGATTNAQAARVDAHAGAQFVHLELSSTLRLRLTSDGGSARALQQALALALGRLEAR